MNSIEVTIPMRPFSVNNSKRPAKMPNGSMRLVSTDKSKSQRRKLELYLLRYRRDLRAMGEAFNPKFHFWRVRFLWVYPHKEYFTQKGTLSRATIDCDNPCKATLDTLFKFVGHDDSGVAELRASKVPGLSAAIQIKLSFHLWGELNDC